MAWSDSEDEKRLKEIFRADYLDNIVYREVVENLVAPGQMTFDLRVYAPKKAMRLDTDTRVGVCWWPNGPVLRGAQLMYEGSTIVFRNLVVKPGAELVVAMEDEWVVEVSAERPGYQPPPPDAPTTGGGSSPSEDFGRGLGRGITSTMLLAGFVLWLYLGAPGGRK